MDTPISTDAGLEKGIDAFLQGQLTEPQAEKLASCDATTLKRVMLITSTMIAEQNDRIAEQNDRIAEQNDRIAEMQSQIAALLEQNATLCEQLATLCEQVARLSKNSSKPPSSDIVKPPGPKHPDGKPRRRGGQPGHRGVCRVAFGPERVDHTEHHHPSVCPLGHRLDAVPTGPVLHVDESGWKDCGVRYWIWIFCTTALSFFVIAKSRSSQVLGDVLGEAYGGTLVSDFFSAYVKYANRLQQFWSCLAHLIRDIKYLTTLPDENEQRFGRVLLLQFKRLFHFRHLRQKIPKDRYDRLMLGLKTRILEMAE